MGSALSILLRRALYNVYMCIYSTLVLDLKTCRRLLLTFLTFQLPSSDSIRFDDSFDDSYSTTVEARIFARVSLFHHPPFYTPGRPHIFRRHLVTTFLPPPWGSTTASFTAMRQHYSTRFYLFPMPNISPGETMSIIQHIIDGRAQ